MTSGAPTKARPPTLRPTPAAAMWFNLCFYGNSGPWRFLQITLWTPAILEATPHLTPTLQRSKQLWEDWPEHPPADTFLLALGFSRYLRSVRLGHRPLKPRLYILCGESMRFTVSGA